MTGTDLAAELAVLQETNYQASHPRREESAAELALRGCAYARDLAPGHTIYHGGAILDGNFEGFMVIEQRPVTVVRGPEPAADFFGRDGHFKWWCRDQLSGREGWWSFGPGGVVRTECMLPWAPLAAQAAEQASQLAAWDSDGGH